MSRKNARYIYTVPTTIEIMILLLIALFGRLLILQNPDLLACSLLFAMGLQNSFVTRISNAVVRTTHLTGLFTDLGIELSQLIFYRQEAEKKKLRASIRLRFTIIGCFFIGGVAGGVFYSRLGLYVLVIGAAILTGGLFYDFFKLQMIRLKRRYKR